MPELHCAYSEGMLASEASETEEAAARAIAPRLIMRRDMGLFPG